MAEDGEKSEKEDRTEAPSAKKIEESRKSGKTPVSKELTSFSALAASTMFLVWYGADIFEKMGRKLSVFFSMAGTLTILPPFEPLWLYLHKIFLDAVLPSMLVTLFTASVFILIQTRFSMSFENIKPQFSGLNPITGLKRIFSKQSLIDTLKSILKIAILFSAIYYVLKAKMGNLATGVYWSPGDLFEQMRIFLMAVLIPVLMVQFGVAAIDIFQVRAKYNSELKMTKEEVKDEQKENEGDPYVRGKVRQLARARSKKSIGKRAAAASVIITNPTHYAVALRYDREKDDAPRVVAKGVDKAAALIRRIAEKHQVPIVPNPPLARLLYTVELDEPVPAEYYKAVAEVIAYIWKLEAKNRKPDDSGHKNPEKSL